MLKPKAEYLPAINYALVHNKIRVLQSVEITNESDADVRDVVVECSGEFFKDASSGVIGIIKAGGSVRLQDLELIPDYEKVASITERITSYFTLKAISKGEDDEDNVLKSETYDIEIMPFDQWLGTTIMPQCLASFVLPNNTAINRVVLNAAAILKEISQSSSFTEYQSGNSNEVRRQIAAIYGALHAENIVYRSIPPSYEQVGQRITLSNQVLSSKLGNCIELTLLFASVLESVGINSGIVIQRGHAYLAVWLVNDCCPYGVCDDSAYIEKKCSVGIDEMLVIECTQVTSERTSFEDAVLIAEKNLADTDKFEMFIDIRRCRLEGIRPLPQRIQNNGVWELAAGGVEHDTCELNVMEHSRYDLSKITNSRREMTKMDLWERKLLDFSLRNSMLNVYLRQKAIQFISFDINLIEDNLQDGEEYMILPKPDVDISISGDGRLVRSKTMPELHNLIKNDVEHRRLHSYYPEGQTKSTLNNIYRASRNAIEETGANALYLAIGLLRWYETDLSEKAHYAPLLMLPVEMVRKKGHFYIRTCDEEIVLNITLVEFLRQNYDIVIPGLDPLPADEHGVDVPKIFAIIRDALKDKKRWDVEEESILGVFSFNKYLMWNDIHSNRDALLENGIIRSLVEQKLVFTPDVVCTDLKNIDKSLQPETLSLPVPVDSSQMAAVIAAGLGRSFILYGPPGTGKSQTITNLIANALFQGKRVLFVAEKMAALTVVQNRLEKIGLAPFCLEMHSNKITKRHVLEQLGKALHVAHIVKPEEYAKIASELFEQRSRIIEYMEALHDTDIGDGLSLFDCIVRYSSINSETLDIDTDDETLKRTFNIGKMGWYRHLLYDKYRSVVNLIGNPSEHPLCGLKVEETDLADISRLSTRISEIYDIIASGLSMHEKMLFVGTLKKEILRVGNDAIFSQNALELLNEWRAIKTKWFIPRFFAKRAYLAKVRSFNPILAESDIDVYLNKVIDYQELRDEIRKLQTAVTSFFDVEYKGDAVPDPESMKGMLSRLECWQKNLEKVRDWYQWCALRRELTSVGLEVVARKIEELSIPAETLADSFFKAMFRNLANGKIARSSILRTFEGGIFDETVSRYRKLTEEFQHLSQKELYARLASRIPHVTDNIDAGSEIGLLNRNISNGGRGMSLRSLIDQIPALMPRLCPCMLMSPMSVAQFLDLSQEKFDLVIFDEASQMPTSEAIGAIARGKAVVVVGDPKQMPPTSFFNSTSVSEDEADIDDMESILEDCRTLELPSIQLNWHYRSKHESLIAFSNNEYYDGSLITFPSVDDRMTKVGYRFIDGVYDKGGHRSNRKEAEAIVDEIVKRLRRPGSASVSIGVVAFSVVQQNLIEDLLTDMLDKDSSLREAAEAMYEPIFIKNLENVQGDERDVIMFSIGYGPDKDGKVSMNFGPLNNAGGERRLNVAVSRARLEMMVFSSLKSSQIDLRRSKAKGVEGLKHFLEYAEQQILVRSGSSSHDTADGVIAGEIASVLRDKGYLAETNIGRSNFKVNVAIGDKGCGGKYSLGILLDGQGYNATQTTRDREIVQPAVLRSLNWRIMRVWSVDWLSNPDRVISRIELLLQEENAESEVEPKLTFDISEEETVAVERCEKPYIRYDAGESPQTMTDRELVFAILKAEQPMTLIYLCRRYCDLRGISRVGSTVVNTIKTIAGCSMYVQSEVDGVTVWCDKESAESFEGYRANNGRDITEIPSVEVMNAILESVREQLSIKRDSLTLIVAKALGFARRGKNVDKIINDALARLIASGRISETDGMLRLYKA